MGNYMRHAGRRFGVAAAAAAILLSLLAVHAASARTYTVRAGDTLSEIAPAYGVPADGLVRDNRLSDPHLIHIGGELNIWDPRGASAGRSNGQYLVQEGDTLSGIAP